MRLPVPFLAGLRQIVILFPNPSFRQLMFFKGASMMVPRSSGNRAGFPFGLLVYFLPFSLQFVLSILLLTVVEDSLAVFLP